jgi:hypothetical protein
MHPAYVRAFSSVIGLVAWAFSIRSEQIPAPLDGGLRVISSFDRLIMIDAVQKELKLTDKQLLKAKEFVHEVRQNHRQELEAALKSSPESDRRRLAAEILRAISKETLLRFKTVLQPDQLTRLIQLDLQERGLGAFSDPEVVKALHLTPEQSAKIQEIARREEAAVQDVLQATEKRASSSTALAKLAALRKQVMGQAVEVLNADQKNSWSALVGPPFEFKIERPSGRQRSSNNTKLPVHI